MVGPSYFEAWAAAPLAGLAADHAVDVCSHYLSATGLLVGRTSPGT